MANKLPDEQRCPHTEHEARCILPVGHETKDRDTGHIMECLANHCHARRNSPPRTRRVDSDSHYRDGLCHRAAGSGTSHLGFLSCSWHGGNSTNGVKAANMALLEAGAATYGLPKDVAPVEALTDELSRTFGHVQDRLRQMQALDPEGLLEGAGLELRRNYLEERRHLLAVCDTLLRGNTEAARARFIGMQAELLDRGLAWLFRELGIAEDPRLEQSVDALLAFLARGEVPAAVPDMLALPPAPTDPTEDR